MRSAEPNGEAILSLREANGWTQEDLAKATDCSVRTIRNAEQGKRIDLKTLKDLAQALNVPIPSIMKRSTQLPQEKHHVQITRQWVNLYLQCDINGLLKLHHPETTLDVPGAENLPAGEITEGVIDIETLKRHLVNAFKIFRLHEIHEQFFYGCGEMVFHCSKASFLAVPTGEILIVDSINEFTFRDGLIYHRRSLTDTVPFRDSIQVD